MANLNAGMLGTGHAYPEGILTNADLEKTSGNLGRVDHFANRHQAAA